ncbi:MAG: TetR/AcrR family transcriptional regulator [Pseudomonadota bacterium]
MAGILDMPQGDETEAADAASSEPEGSGASGKQRPSRRAQILDVAERMARTGGYNGFSFRDIASEVGVKSASVHYHFPTKADLAVALLSRFREREMAELGPPTEPGAMLRLIGIYRAAVADGHGICLAGHFGAGCLALPEPVQAEVARFFDEMVAWAAACLGETGDERTGAEAVIAGLEGAMILALSTRDVPAFDRAATRLLEAAKGQPWRSANA